MDAASQTAAQLMQAAAPANKAISSSDFGNAAAACAELYQTSPQQYYAAMSAISDSKMRDLVDYSVLDTMLNHSNNASNTQLVRRFIRQVRQYVLPQLEQGRFHQQRPHHAQNCGSPGWQSLEGSAKKSRGLRSPRLQ